MLGSLVVALLAAPDAGTTWVWSFDDSIAIKVEKGNVDVHPHASVRRAQLSVTVTEAGEIAPKRFVVQVLEGNDTLKGRTWNVENNYGEPMLSEVGARKKGPPTTAKEALAQQQGAPQDDLRAFTRVVGTLLTPDPIVEAAQRGPPCDEAVRMKIGEATAKLTMKLSMARGDGLTVEAVQVSCEPKKPGVWSVQFALRLLVEDQPVVTTYRGTVSTAPGAWRASLAMQGSGKIELNSGRTAVRVRNEQTLKSSLKPK